MSQTAPGEGGSDGVGANPAHASNKFIHQQPIQAPVGANFLTQGQGAAPYGGYVPPFPVKPTNPHMGNGYPTHGAMQFNMHSSHLTPQHLHPMAMKSGSNDSTNVAMQHSYQQNYCGNLPYFSGGNYVTTLTVNPGDQHHPPNQMLHTLHQQQFMSNSQNYYINSSGTPMMNNMNYVSNMTLQHNANKNVHSNEANNVQKVQSTPVSESPNYSEVESKPLNQSSKENKISDASFSSTSLPINQKNKTTSELSGGNSHNGDAVNSGCKKVTTNFPSHRTCTNNSNNNNNSFNNRPRTNSRCDSVRSETGESSCSSLSAESVPDQTQYHHHHNQHPMGVKSNPHPYFPGNNNFANNPMQAVNNYSGTGTNNNGGNSNVNYQNYMTCQARMNQVIGKPGMYNNNNPGLVQALQQMNTVQHVQVQHGQVHIMQQQYQALQNSGAASGGRQGMGIAPNNSTGMSHGQSGSAMVSGGNNLLQGQTIPNSGMMTDHGNSQSQNINLRVPDNCVGHSGSVIPQTFSASGPMGQVPHQTVMHSQGKGYPLNLQQSMMGMTGSHSAGNITMNKGFPPIVIVPFGWKRLNNNGQVTYVSPSGSELRSAMEVCNYLRQENTCKCGLQCPLRVENIFCFDPKVPHRITMPDELSSGEATKVCNHRRKLAVAVSHHLQKQAKKEDGRKKRKRKGEADAGLESTSPSSIPSPMACSPTVPQPSPMVPFNTQQQQDLSQMQQQQQQQMFQTTPHNQNWNGMYNVPRLMVPNNGMGGCQGAPDNYHAMNTPPQGSAGSFINQHPSNCCENHSCFNAPPIMYQRMRTPYGPMGRAPFCRMSSDPMLKGMTTPQGVGCGVPQQSVAGMHSMIGNRAPFHPIANGPMCRMPLNNNSVPAYGGAGNMGVQQGTERSTTPQGLSQGAAKVPQLEEGEKRRRGPAPRPRKKLKTVDRSSPCPNVDVRNLRGENTVSPHTGPGPPFHATPPPTSQSDSQVESSGNTSNPSRPGQSSVPISGPSFMEDPNGYLAQQTVLLNNTMAGGGVGQFSPQGARVSPRPSVTPSQSSTSTSVPPKTSQGFIPKSVSSSNIRSTSSLSSPSVVPLPSNVPLPARVSKVSASSSSSSSNSGSNTAPTVVTVATSSLSTLCTSVHSKSSTSSPSSQSKPKGLLQERPLSHPDQVETSVATAESSFVNHTVTVTYTSSSVTTTTCGSESNSPHSSQDVESVVAAEIPSSQSHSDTDELHTSKQAPLDKGSNKSSSLALASSTVKTLKSKGIEVPSSKKADVVSDCIIASSSRKKGNASSGSSELSAEAANKPLTPGPAESSINTQSPLEMVQNIVSSIPVPASDEISSLQGKIHNHQTHLVSEQPSQSMHPPLSHQILSPHLYNMAGTNNMTGVMYNPNGGALRGTGSLVVHGPTPSGSINSGVLVSNSGNMVVVTSPFTSKMSVSAPVVCSNVTGIAPMVGVQTVPQVQVQPSLASVQSHQLQPHIQQIQPVQPVVQFVNTFATMQTPVIIQNGSNIIQSPSGVLSGHGGVIGPASLIPSSTPTFMTSQQLLAVDSPSHSSHVQMAHMVTSASSEASDDNRLTPVATPATTPTPHSTPGSETPPSGGSSNGSGKKRKRRRNTSTPQGNPQQQQQQQQQQNIVPTIIMGKQLPQEMVMNGTQLSQVAPYGSVAGTHVATVTAMGPNGGPGSTTGGQILTATGQPTNSINVVQMVGGPVAGPLPVHLQQPPTILVPLTATPGSIINQLPDGTFVSTDPNTGVTYPVQLQLSGSHIVGVTPIGNSNSNPGVVASITTPSSIPQGTVVAVRPPTAPTNPVVNGNTKLINLSPSLTSQGETLVNNVYGVSPSVSHGAIVSASVATDYSNPSASFSQQLPTPNAAPEESPLQQSLIGNATLLQQKTTTIVAQQTTVVATQGGLVGTHSSVSTQTPGLLGESDVSSSDCIANQAPKRDISTSPSHQSAEVTTTRQDEDSASTPESLLVSPHSHSSPESPSKKLRVSPATNHGQEPHSATATENGKMSEAFGICWGFHRGHHYWPSQVLHQSGGEATVRWFGDHSVEKVPLSSLSHFPSSPRKINTRRSFRGKTALDEAIAEASHTFSSAVSKHRPVIQSSDDSAISCSTTTPILSPLGEDTPSTAKIPPKTPHSSSHSYLERRPKKRRKPRS